MKTLPQIFRQTGRGLVVAAFAVTLSACAQDDETRLAFQGVYFKTKASKVDDNRQRFTVSVKNMSLAPQGAIEAGEFEATRYCITNYGTSRIIWSAGPDRPLQQLPVVNDTLTLAGECNP